MVYIKWDKLLQLKKQTNESPVIKARWRGWIEENGKIDKTPIYGRNAADIYHAFRVVISDIKEDYPDDWKRGFPPEIIAWYEDDQETRIVVPTKGRFIRVPHLMVDGEYLKELKPTEWKVLTIIARHAYFGDGVREEAGFEIRHGQTFVGAAKIAEEAGMCESNVRKALSSLTEKGHLLVVDRQWDGKRNLCLRMVAFLDETFV